MRFRSLELKAFGPFTDRRLELVADVGLQLVYGANEAGKSSALRGISNLLFGFGHQTPDDHLHTGPSLRIGAEVEDGAGARLRFLRRKGRTQTLLDPDGEPIDDDSLRSFLGGADRTFFESVFGLDHERLRRGGQQILEAGGELGLSLFGAATGIVELSAILARLKADTEELFLPRGKRPINEAIAALEGARKRIREAHLSSGTWHGKRQQVEAKQREHADLVAGIERLQTARARIERICRNLPLLAERRDCIEALAELGELPDLAADTAQRRVTAQGALHEARRDVEHSRKEIARLERDLQDRELPAALLAHAAEIDRLADEKASGAKAERDRPGLEAQCKQLSTQVANALRQAGFPAPPEPTSAVLPTTPAVKALRALIQRGTELAAEIERQRERARVAGEHAAGGRSSLDALPAPRDISVLAAALPSLDRQGELEERLRQARTAQSNAEDTASRELARLPLWRDDLAALASAPVPSGETVARFAERMREARSRLSDDRKTAAAGAERIARLENELRRLAAQGEVPSPEAVEQARRRREAAWRLLRRGWVDGRDDVSQAAREIDANRPLPEAYERLVAEADALADRRHKEADRIARKASLLVDLGEERAERELTQAAVAQCEQEDADLQREWRAQWEPCGIEPLSPEEMQGWLVVRHDLVRRADAIAESLTAVEQLADRLESTRESLRRALEAAGDPCGEATAALEGLLVRGRKALEREDALSRERERLRDRIAGHEAELADAHSCLAAREEDRRQWQEQWTVALAPLGRQPNDTTEVIEEVIDRLDAARKGIEVCRDLQSRVSHMAEDAAAFAAQVGDLARVAAPDLAGRLPVEAASEMATRLQRAKTNHELQEKDLESLARQRARVAEAEQRIADAQRDLDGLCHGAGCRSPEELEEIERRVAALRQRNADLAKAERALREGGAGLSLEELAAEAQAIDPDKLRAQSATLDEELKRRQGERDGLSADVALLSTELAAMDGSDAAACAAQEAEDTLARLRNDADRFVQLRLAELVLRRAIDRYKERNQGPILARARELFADLTLGAYERLTVDYDDPGRPQLQGITGDGRVRSVAQMSDGTRDQLYLALRLAVIERHLEAGQRLPLVVDDLLLHFDDNRARQALVVLAELGHGTQVLFFTHHRHLVELARQALPPSAYAVQEL